MPGPYDYTINIPQPPAQNFLQSLMGIMQLRQMQEQSAIQQQQAAIAQQNAAFQQQMQPLQLEAERARIGQIGQATAAAAEALRGSRLQNEQLQRQSDFQKELVDFTSKPVEQWSESEVRSLAAKGSAIDPARTRGVLEFWANQPKPEKNLVDDTAMKAGIAIAQNRPDVAKSIVDQAKSDAKKLGFTTASKFLDFGGFQLDQDPAYAYATILGHFATDKAKLDQLVTASELKGKMAQTAALTQEALAKAYSTKETKQVDEEKRALDLEKERLQIRELEQKLGEQKPEKPLPSSLLRANAEINKSVDSANEMADKLEQASEAIRGLPSRGFFGQKKIQLKQLLRGVEIPEITIRNNAAQLAGLGMLGAEKTAMGGAIRSNVQFQYATGKLPDAYQSPQALADRLAEQAQVQRKISKLMAIDAEWNSAFRGSQKAKTDEEILGYMVPAGTSRTQFKEMVAKELFPSQATQPRPTATTSNLGSPVSTGTLPVAPTGGTIDLGGGNTATFKLKK